MPGTNIDRSPHYGQLQMLIDKLFSVNTSVDRLDAVVLAEVYDFPPDLMEIVGTIPPGRYERQRMCDQINSSLSGHAWGQVYGTVG